MSRGRIRRMLGRGAQREINEPAAPELTLPDAAVILPNYYDDGLMKAYGRNADALLDDRFTNAYAAGMGSGHSFTWPGVDKAVDMPWRVYMACWAATHALNVEGDFVECGVHTGMLSLAVCTYVDFNATGKTFFLFDTFSGIPEDQMSETERPRRVTENEAFYSTDTYEIAKRNFAPFPRVRLVRGMVPETLASADIGEVGYLSLDLNIVAPELAAIEFFWPKLSRGAVVLLDDYGWEEYREQKEAMDAFAARFAVPIATLPTGQGLLIKP
jgi:O-methyltransferase